VLETRVAEALPSGFTRHTESLAAFSSWPSSPDHGCHDQSRDGLAQFPCLLSIDRRDEPLSIRWRGELHNRCTCAEAAVTKYQKRIAGPLLDRIDIHVEDPRVDDEKFSTDWFGESSESIRKLVQTSRDI